MSMKACVMSKGVCLKNIEILAADMAYWLKPYTLSPMEPRMPNVS